jgi:hypothetical protein
MDERYYRNVEVNDLLEIWEWCSRRLHVRWDRKRKLRNGCYIGLACALSEDGPVRPMGLLKTFKSLPKPLLDRKKVIAFWEVQPVALLELCLGSYTKASALAGPLNNLRKSFRGNPILDDLAKKMRSREKRFGDDWYTEGHHPNVEYVSLKRQTKQLRSQLRNLIADAHETVSELALDVLAKGWQYGEIPAACWVRRTPETLLNKASRLRLWEAGHVVLDHDLGEDDLLNALWDALHKRVSPALRNAIEAQGHKVDDVVCDFISFDLKKTRAEITV